jgi:Bacterial Ig domain/CHRD domain
MRHIIFRLLAGALPLILTSCGGGYGSGGGGMGATPCGGAYSACPLPTIALTAPASGATVSGTAVMLTATAAASTMNGLTVTRVDFMIDGTIVGTATTSPYTFSWNSTSVTKGSHSLTAKVTDSVNGTATTPAIMINTTGMAVAAVAMTAAQIFPAPSSSASGTANISVNLASGATSGNVMLRGLTATAVTLNEGFAGATGPRVITLVANGAAGEWQVPAGALLTAEQVSALTQGKLYVIAASAANPRGEVRGQIAPDNIVVTFSSLERTPEVAAVGLAAGGVAATTVDTTANTLTIHVNSTGVDDAMAAQVATGAAGASAATLAELSKDSVNMGHWSTELVAISAADVANFKAGRWQVSVATAVHPNGAIGGQITD